MSPKILVFDLEQSPTLQWAYGIYKTYGLKTEIDPFIICFSYRWYGESKTHNVKISLGKGDVFNHVRLRAAEEVVVRRLWEVLDEADIVVAHNAVGFDNKVAMAAFLRHNMKPPSPFKTVDTLKVARSVARFNSNSLNNLGQLFGLGKKTELTHKELWYDTIMGVKKAMKLMVLYCNQDVDLLYKLYEKLRPYAKTHPNISAFRNGAFCCTYCGSSRLRENKRRTTGTGTYLYYLCNDCGHYPRERKADKDFDRPALVA